MGERNAYRSAGLAWFRLVIWKVRGEMRDAEKKEYDLYVKETRMCFTYY
jgi:hypothetical protein